MPPYIDNTLGFGTELVSLILAETFFPHCVREIWCMFLYNEGGKLTKGKKKYGPLPPSCSASLLCFWRRCLQSEFLWACPHFKTKICFCNHTGKLLIMACRTVEGKNTHWDVSFNDIKEKSSVSFLWLWFDGFLFCYTTRVVVQKSFRASLDI